MLELIIVKSAVHHKHMHSYMYNVGHMAIATLRQKRRLPHVIFYKLWVSLLKKHPTGINLVIFFHFIS